MIEVKGDFWEFEDCDWKCITTNNCIRSNGRAVMGAGIALSAKKRYKDIDLALARKIKLFPDRRVLFLGKRLGSIKTFKTFSFYSFQTKYDWRFKSDLILIKESAKELKDRYYKHLVEAFPPKILIPKPGCSNGGLEWKDVKKVIEPIFDTDDFIIISRD